MQLTAILAMDESRLIGAKNGLPWHIPEDLKRFRDFTTGHTVVMGRNTWLSLPEKFRPLPNRRNIVITRSEIDGVETYPSLEACIDAVKNSVDQVFLIGGAQLYNYAFQQGLVDQVELTLVHGTHDGDTYMDEFRDGFHQVARDDFDQGSFTTLIRNP